MSISEQFSGDAQLYSRLRLRWTMVFFAVELLFLMGLVVLNDRFAPTLHNWPLLNDPLSCLVCGGILVLAVCLAFLAYLFVMFPVLDHLRSRLPGRFGLTTRRGWRRCGETAGQLFARAGVGIGLILVMVVPRMTLGSWWPLVTLALVAAWVVDQSVWRPRWRLWGYKIGRFEDNPKVEELRRFVRRQQVAKAEIISIRIAPHGTQILAAAWAGIWGARVYISDTAVEQMSMRELRVLVAHELGHIKHLDSLRGIARRVIGSVCIALCLCAVLARIAPDPRLPREAVDAAGMLLLSLWLLSFFVRPLYTTGSIRQESGANEAALEMAGDAVGFISAMRKIAESNLIAGRPVWWEKLFFETHPSLEEVIGQALRYAAEHNIPIEDEDFESVETDG